MHTTDAAKKQFWFCNHTPVDGSEQVLERAPESSPWDEKLGEEERTGRQKGGGGVATSCPSCAPSDHMLAFRKLQ